MSWKLCTGRGLTNAKPRFQQDGTDYASNNSETHDVNMYGFIFEPYNDGQYMVSSNWARAENLIGFAMDQSGYMYGANPMTGVRSYETAQTVGTLLPVFRSFGDLDLATVMFKAEGVGSGISDFLDSTTVFASWAQSKTHPKSPMPGETARMLGSSESQTGTSVWIGANIPCPLTKDGRIGVEWNKGSKYWRGVTYGEDTMAGSKIAARGTATEVYYTKPITKSLSWDLRYTKMDYDYTGSNSFFGDDGKPIAIADAKAAHAANPSWTADPVEKASDLRASIS